MAWRDRRKRGKLMQLPWKSHRSNTTRKPGLGRRTAVGRTTTGGERVFERLEARTMLSVSTLPVTNRMGPVYHAALHVFRPLAAPSAMPSQTVPVLSLIHISEP